MTYIVIAFTTLFLSCKKDDNKINDLLLGTWERFVEIDCSVNNCWHERMTFQENKLYTFYELRPFNSDWILISDSLHYKVEDGKLTLEDRHGTYNTYDIKKITNKKLIYEDANSNYEWKKID